MNTLTLDSNKKYQIADLLNIVNNQTSIRLSKNTEVHINNCFEALQKTYRNKTIYGLNTGVGSLSKKAPEEISQYQKNLLLSHSCPVGKNLPQKVVRAMILARILTFSKGKSGVSLRLVKFLVSLLNKNVIPQVASMGSIGLCDLANSAQAYSVIFNKGKVIYKNKTQTPFSAFKKSKIRPLKQLQLREGLALIEGNDTSVGISMINIQRLNNLFGIILKVSALSLEAKKSTFATYNPINQKVRPFQGQKVVAQKFKKMLKNSDFILKKYCDNTRSQIQDPPSFKTICLCLGNLYEKIKSAESIIKKELNSTIDNPLIIPNKTYCDIISSANYYNIQIAEISDQLCSTLSSVGSSSVARMQILNNSQFNNDLPDYLINVNRSNSGFMIPIYTAQALLTEMKALCFPRAIFSSTVSNGWEDISTNAVNASINLKRTIHLTQEVTNLEFLLVIQALSLRKNIKPSLKLGRKTNSIFIYTINELNKKGYKFPLKKDIYMKDLIDSTRAILLSLK